MRRHHVTIKAGPLPCHAEVWLDGEPVLGILAYHISQNTNGENSGMPLVTLVLEPRSLDIELAASGVHPRVDGT